jgi:CopA family copper-resistance protein
VEGLTALGALQALDRVTPAYAWADAANAALTPRTAPSDGRAGPDGVIDLTIDTLPFDVRGRRGQAVAVNGSVPGPLVRLREGQEAVIRVDNRVAEMSSIHWHGVLVPPEMDGVPGVSFAGIPPRSVFTYRFPVRQSGTYWAHAHDAHELVGLYFPLIIDPIEPEPFQYDRDYVVMLSDWSFEPPLAIISKLKSEAGYYNFQKRTAGDFIGDVRRRGVLATIKDRAGWARMRMDPTDFADVTGFTYTYLLNGLAPDANWTGLFHAGERVRLRFIAAGAMTYFDVRIHGLPMTVVQADGQNVRPVDVDEFRIAPGETLDVVVRPEDRAYTLFAESLDRSGYARGTLAPRGGMTAPVPPRRSRPLRTMVDMGMSDTDDMSGMAGMAAMAGMATDGLKGPSLPGSPPVMHGPASHGPGNSSVPMSTRNRLDDPGSGFGEATGKVLVYTDLRSLASATAHSEPTREVELHITGNMERYSWSFDGKTYAEAQTPIPFRYGERLRLFLVNDTMMEHPIHLHGMWMELENGAGAEQPRKHTISVKPAERLSVLITAAARGRWALHCHLLLHMEMGMFRVVEVGGAPVGVSRARTEGP